MENRESRTVNRESRIVIRPRLYAERFGLVLVLVIEKHGAWSMENRESRTVNRESRIVIGPRLYAERFGLRQSSAAYASAAARP
jgi:hypothetical protein